MNSLVRSSDYYLGNRESINPDFIKNNTLFLCDLNGSPVLGYKTGNGLFKFYAFTLSEGKILLKAKSGGEDIPISLEHPKDFDEKIKAIATAKESQPLDKSDYQATFIEKGIKMLEKAKSKADAEKIIKSPWFSFEAPLMSAYESKNEKIFNLILSFVNDINKVLQPEVSSSIFFKAIEENDSPLVNILLNKKINTGIRSSPDDYSPLMAAISIENVNMVKGLLKHPEIQKSINDVNRFDEMAIIMAVNKLNHELVEVLLENGANPTLPKNPSLIETAVSFNDLAMTKLLLSDKRVAATINEKNADGDTLFSLAEKSNAKQEILDFLITHGAIASEAPPLLPSGGPIRREEEGEKEEERPKGPEYP
jgi:hypothetical protein